MKKVDEYKVVELSSGSIHFSHDGANRKGDMYHFLVVVEYFINRENTFYEQFTLLQLLCARSLF